MKGIILAGGAGTRLRPLTRACSKQLLPVYNKPMIYYSLSVLLLAEIKDILVITNPEYISRYNYLLGHGEDLGCRISFLPQSKPGGLPEAFLIGETFLNEDHCCLVLGDNIFYGGQFKEKLMAAQQRLDAGSYGATIFCYPVPKKHVNKYGIAKAETYIVRQVVEKPEPENAPSNLAVTGLYFFRDDVCEKARRLSPSQRGELEIADLINAYTRETLVHAEFLGRGFSWFDTGTIESLHAASSFVYAVETQTGQQVCNPFEIALHNNWIDYQVYKENTFSDI